MRLRAFGRRSGGHLLGGAVNRRRPRPTDRHCGDDFAGRIVALQRTDGLGVGVRVAEPGRNDGAVAGVIITVARDEIYRRYSAFVAVGDDVDAEPRLFRRIMGIPPGKVERVAMVGVIRQVDQHTVWASEPRETVDMVVGKILVLGAF